MTELDNRVEINVEIQDTTVTTPGFGTLGIVHQHQQTSLEIVQTYLSLEGVLEDFPSYTPVGKFASIVYSQAYTPEQIKVIYRSSSQSMTEALDAAIAVDSDFYAVATPSKDTTDIEAGAAWCLANDRFFGYSSGESDAVTSATTDTFSEIQALSNNRAAGWYSADVGLEFFIDTITVATTTATADITDFVTAHGSNPFVIGDTIGIWTSAVDDLNSVWEVLTVGTNDFTFTVPLGTASDVAESDAWQNFNLLEAAIFGKMLPQDAGAKTWDIQLLSGVSTDSLTGTQQVYLGGKYGNWFATIGGLNVTSGLKTGGGGGKTFSGRYIDIQRGADWLSTNLQADLFALMVNEGGDLGYDADGLQKVETVIAIRLNDGLDKRFLTQFTSGQYEGLDYNISMPNLSDIPAVDKTNRLLSDIQIDANIRGKIHNMEATLTLST